MKILYFLTDRYPTERAYGIQINKTVEALRMHGADVTIRSPYQILQPLLRLGKLGHYLRTFIFKNWLWFTGQLRGYTHMYTRDLFAAFELSFVGKPVFLELHDIKSSQATRRIILMRNVRGVIVISNGLKQRLLELGVPESKISVAPDAVEYEKFAIDTSKEEARQKFNLPLSKKIILYAGLFDEWKGYGTLLTASRSLPDGTLLVMAGGRPEQVNDLMKKFENVKFLGWTEYDKLPVLQRAADVLVLPNSGKYEISRLYTSPLKLFTAMASGVPIVASDLPSMREVVDETMVTFTTPDNPQALARVIAEVLENTSLSQTKAAKAREEVRKYSWENRAHAILAFIKS